MLFSTIVIVLLLGNLEVLAGLAGLSGSELLFALV